MVSDSDEVGEKTGIGDASGSKDIQYKLPSAAEKSDVASAATRRRQASRKSSHMNGKTLVMIAAAAGTALIAAVLGGSGGGSGGGRGGERGDRYPALQRFLEDTNIAASKAIQGDVGAACADPKRWLNSAGNGVLSELPGFNQHNTSMLWGTYRPGVYFGLKTRTSPAAVTAGLIWHGGDGDGKVDPLRHECNEGDGLGPYGWVEHDGVSYGKQDIADQKAGVRLVTSMVKPAQLGIVDAERQDVRSDVLLATRIEVLPNAEGRTRGPSSIYFYVGLECSKEEECSQELATKGGLTVGDSTVITQQSLVVRGTVEQIGKFGLEAAAHAGETSGDQAGGVTVAFAGKAKVPLVDVKRTLEGMQAEHLRAIRRERQADPKLPARRPFVLPNTVDEGSSVVLIQVTGQAPFSADFIFRDAGESSRGTVHTARITAENMTKWLDSGSRKFSERFSKTFSLEENGFEPRDVAAAKAALSNMLGGMGHFAGRSEVRAAGQDGRNGASFETELFTAVPSRSFFPRGFLWDEGFHQLLVNAWDRSTSIDVLGHWLSLLHVHDQREGGDGIGVYGGWLPREQILGEEARRRVPSEFVAQDVTVANPPTFLLLVDNLLQSLTNPASSESKELSNGPTKERVPSAKPSCSTDSILGGADVECTVKFLKEAHPLLDQWVRWLLITQRPGAKGWGAREKRSPMGAFQWRGRDPSDDRLNALTLASGLDDYPRASHPSQGGEWHVDVLCWLALGCKVMDRLATAVEVESLPYGEIFDEILGGMFNLHWHEETEIFFDYGKHVSDGEVIDEAIMRCQRADGSTVDIGARLEDIKARKIICPDGQRHLYPLGDGHGGFLTRKRWRGGSPRTQQVQHIGYVGIFPLLLRLLPADNPAVGSLLAHIRDSTELWSPYGLRSLSASDPLYQVENNPGDEPYWRGHIWINVNYLALAALQHYSEAEGPFSKDAARIYSELRRNVLGTLLGGYHSTGYFWEQYDDRTGKGLRSHPFTGWSALVVMIMAEMY